jgi:hypothetical protein
MRQTKHMPAVMARASSATILRGLGALCTKQVACCGSSCDAPSRCFAPLQALRWRLASCSPAQQLLLLVAWVEHDLLGLGPGAAHGPLMQVGVAVRVPGARHMLLRWVLIRHDCRLWRAAQSCVCERACTRLWRPSFRPPLGCIMHVSIRPQQSQTQHTPRSHLVHHTTQHHRAQRNV